MIKLFVESHGEIVFQTWKFPGGEIGVKIPEEYHKALTSGKFIALVHREMFTSDEAFVILNLLDAMYHLGVQRNNLRLYFDYLPYARQDRVCNKGESFALQVFVKMLASQSDKFGDIFVVDPHSEVTKEQFRKFNVEIRIQHQSSCVNRTFNATDDDPVFDFVIAPDKGAHVKAKLAIDETWDNWSDDDKPTLITLTKERKDGKVQHIDYTEQRLYGDLLVVDDICDGGATFISVAKMIRRLHPEVNTLSLYVTHGLFSNGLEELTKHYDTIYTFNNMQRLIHPQLKSVGIDL